MVFQTDKRLKSRRGGDRLRTLGISSQPSLAYDQHRHRIRHLRESVATIDTPKSCRTMQGPLPTHTHHPVNFEHGSKCLDNLATLIEQQQASEDQQRKLTRMYGRAQALAKAIQAFVLDAEQLLPHDSAIGGGLPQCVRAHIGRLRGWLPRICACQLPLLSAALPLLITIIIIIVVDFFSWLISMRNQRLPNLIRLDQLAPDGVIQYQSRLMVLCAVSTLLGDRRGFGRYWTRVRRSLAALPNATKGSS